MRLNSKSIFKLLFYIILMDNVACAIVTPLLIGLLYPCTLDTACKALVNTHNLALLSGFLLLLSPSYLIMSPILGHLSDILGRKIMLFWCLLLSFIGYSILFAAINYQNIFLSLLAILLLNAGSSSMTIVQAAIADISHHTTKSKYFIMVSLVMLPLYLIFAKVGDAIIDLNPTAIILKVLITAFAFLATLGNLIFISKYLPEIRHTKNLHSNKHNFSHFEKIISIFNKDIIILLLLLGFFQFGTSIYYESITAYLINYYHATENDLAIFLSYKVLIMTISLLFVYPLLLKYIANKNIIFYCLLLCSLGILGDVFVNKNLLEWIFIIPFTMGEILFIPTVWTMLSDAGNKNNQGIIMGIKGSIWSLAWSMGLSAGNKLNITLTPSIAISSALIMIVGCFILLAQLKQRTNSR